MRDEERPVKPLSSFIPHPSSLVDAPVDFPWSRLDPNRPLVYASMGTLQNGILQTFRMIAEACAGLDLQLMISLGGGQDPALDLPGKG
jgi:zeaxanthin glucosyltransferase